MSTDCSTLRVAIFWDIAPCSPYVKRRFGGTAMRISNPVCHVLNITIRVN
jgi:hypothetical protein